MGLKPTSHLSFSIIFLHFPGGQRDANKNYMFFVVIQHSAEIYIPSHTFTWLKLRDVNNLSRIVNSQYFFLSFAQIFYLFNISKNQ